MGPTPVSRYSVFFFSSTQLTEANIIKKKKKLNGQPGKEKKRKKKKHKQPTPTQEKKTKNKKKKNTVPIDRCGTHE